MRYGHDVPLLPTTEGEPPTTEGEPPTTVGEARPPEGRCLGALPAALLIFGVWWLITLNSPTDTPKPIPNATMLGTFGPR